MNEALKVGLVATGTVLAISLWILGAARLSDFVGDKTCSIYLETATFCGCISLLCGVAAAILFHVVR